MQKDARGNDVTTDNPAAIAAINRTVDQWLGYGQGASAIFEGVAADPRCVMVQVLGAVLNLSLESAAGRRSALPLLARARQQVEKATRREQLWLHAVEAWAKGDTDLAIRLHLDIAARWPGDLANVKLGQYHQFNQGDSAGMLALSEATLAANRDDPHAHGMRAFALAENRRLREAEQAGRHAVALRRREPWAHHAVAHVLAAEGRIDEGIEWLEAHADCWDDCNSFMLTHNYWHLALMHLDRDDAGAALDLYDTRIWGIWKDCAQDQVNAASLLWRLECRGVNVGNRWRDLARHVALREADHVEPFLDLHYLIALLRGSPAQAERFLASLIAHAPLAKRHRRPDWTGIALPLAAGLDAMAKGDHGAAASHLAEALPRLDRIGGSRAQREIFIESWIAASLRAGRAAGLGPVLTERARQRPTVARHFRELAHLARIEGAIPRAIDAEHRAEALARSYAV